MAAGGGDDVDGGGGGVRKKGAAKGISLELIYKSGGLENKLILSPSPSPSSSSPHARKHGNEWLKALKKVREKSARNVENNVEIVCEISKLWQVCEGSLYWPRLFV